MEKSSQSPPILQNNYQINPSNQTFVQLQNNGVSITQHSELTNDIGNNELDHLLKELPSEDLIIIGSITK